jgi:hypothetical protein
MYFSNFLFMTFLLVTWVIAPIALIVLVRKQRFRLVFYFILAIVIGPMLFRLIMSIKDQHLRTWVVMPFSIFIPVYLMLGFWICAKACDTLNEQSPREMPLAVRGKHNSFRMTTRRYIGFLLIAVGIAAWSYGAAHPQLGSGQQTLIAILALYSLLFGGYWAATGKKLL